MTDMTWGTAKPGDLIRTWGAVRTIQSVRRLPPSPDYEPTIDRIELTYTDGTTGIAVETCPIWNAVPQTPALAAIARRVLVEAMLDAARLGTGYTSTVISRHDAAVKLSEAEIDTVADIVDDLAARANITIEPPTADDTTVAAPDSADPAPATRDHFDGYQTPETAIEAAARALCDESARTDDRHDPAWTWLDFIAPARIALEAGEVDIAAAARELAAKWLEDARDEILEHRFHRVALTAAAEIVRRGLE